MGHERAKRSFIAVPSIAIMIVGLVLVLYASTSFGEEGKGTVFYAPLGVPGIIAVVIGLMGLLLLRISRVK